MTRTIKASEIKRGMKIRVDPEGWDITGTVGIVGLQTRTVSIHIGEGRSISLGRADEVTVLSEPQPEEPTWFGARVVVNEQRFLRAPEGEDDCHAWLKEGEGVWYDWDNLLRMGPVQVVPDQGWTIPDTLEVPERINKWDTWGDVPEGVAVTTSGLFCHYRKNQGWVEVSYPKENPDWMKCGIRYMSHRYAPWTRVTDA